MRTWTRDLGGLPFFHGFPKLPSGHWGGGGGVAPLYGKRPMAWGASPSFPECPIYLIHQDIGVDGAPRGPRPVAWGASPSFTDFPNFHHMVLERTAHRVKNGRKMLNILLRIFGDA